MKNQVFFDEQKKDVKNVTQANHRTHSTEGNNLILKRRPLFTLTPLVKYLLFRNLVVSFQFMLR